MKDKVVYNCLDFPCEEFGSGLKRQIRLIVSPQTTGEENMDIVHCTIPPHAISEGHVHDDSAEYIFFDIGGKAVLDGTEYEVPPHGIICARPGVNHECVNTCSDKDLHLFCVFTPAFEPYGKYPDLIEKTKQYLEKTED